MKHSAALAVTLWMATAAYAQAAVVSTYDDPGGMYTPWGFSPIDVKDAEGETNTLSIERRENDVLIHDGTAPLSEESDRCEQLDPQTVSCEPGPYRAFLTVALGAGNDSVIVQGGLSPATILGGPGDDELQGDTGPDELVGGVGRDRIDGGPGDDQLIEGPTQDEPAAAEPDVLAGGPGLDTVSYAGRDRSVEVDLRSGEGAGERDERDALIRIENVIGGNAPDVLTGTGAANVIEYGPGDTVVAKGGDDLIKVPFRATRTPRISCGLGLDEVSFHVAREPGPPLSVARGCERFSSYDFPPHDEGEHRIGSIDLHVRKRGRSVLRFAAQGWRAHLLDLYLPGRRGRVGAKLGAWHAAYPSLVRRKNVAVALTSLGRRTLRPGTSVRVVMHVSWSDYDAFYERDPWATAWVTVLPRHRAST